MIPKVIHYCWFGKKEKPDNVKKCIQSWKQKCPDYSFIEWNEDNFDVSSFEYCSEAYAERKYAFVSDVARAKALYEMGGIYLDTDVTVLQSFDPILNNSVVLGFEEDNFVATSFMASAPRQELFREFVQYYEERHFVNEDGTYNAGTNVLQLTKMLIERGLTRSNEYQIVDGYIAVYPKEFFSPYDYINCVYELTDSSICVHHFFVSWMSWTSRAKKKIKSILVKIIGKKMLIRLRNFIIKIKRC